jgi:prephenate dehydratase
MEGEGTTAAAGEQRWAFLGPEGTFSEQAARTVAADSASGPVRFLPAPDVPTALRSLRDGDVEVAVVALESSVEGSVPVTQDELIHGGPLQITAEVHLPVRFDLLGRPGAVLTDVTTVGAHPHGLAQVRRWLAEHLPDAQPVAAESNAAAALDVAAGRLDAAAAGSAAADRYGLVPMASDIGDERDAVTRFVLLRRPGAVPPPTGNDRTSLAMAVDNRPGALLELLTEFALRGINLTRLESRPLRRKLGEYVFLVDADGHLADPALADVLAALHRRAALWRVLGSYPRRDGVVDPPPGYATDRAYEQAADRVRRWRQGDWT